MSATLPTYSPRPGSLPARVCEFFRDNPDEELTRSDLAAKFDVQSSSIDPSLKHAVDAGVIATKNGEDMTRVWIAGPQLPAPSSFKRWLASKGQASAEGRPVAAALPDPASLLQGMATDVPLPKQQARGSEYYPVWLAMAVGASVPVSSEAAKALAAKAQAWGKASGKKFVQRLLPNGTARIWRTE